MKAQFAAICMALGLALAPTAYSADKAADEKGGTRAAVKEEMTDAGITTRIKTEYAKDKEVSAMKISVDTEKGVVKLTGNAKSKSEADKAEQIAKNTKGVTSVKNEIKVGSADKSSDKGMEKKAAK